MALRFWGDLIMILGLLGNFNVLKGDYKVFGSCAKPSSPL